MHRPPLLAACALFVCALRGAHAAGGHHAVDDAAILEPGQCQMETWADAFRGGYGDGHLGSACRVGDWELGLNVDRVAIPGESHTHAIAPQAKWATAVARDWSAGIVLMPSIVNGRYSDFQALVPVTWQARETTKVHFNLGRDIPRAGTQRTLAGIATEWAPVKTWSFVAERFNDASGRAVRVGTRWQPDELFSVDLSHAHASDARGSWWTLGASYVFGRR